MTGIEKNSAPQQKRISEFLEEVIIEDNFFRVCSDARKSYLLLEGLYPLFAQYAFAKEEAVKANSLKEKAVEVCEHYRQAHDHLNLKANIQDAPMPIEPKQMTLEELLSLVRTSLKIRAQIDKTQADILEFLTETETNIADNLVGQYPDLKEMYIQLQTELIMDRAFSPDIVEEDRVVTFLLTSKDKQSRKVLNLPIEFKLRDYSFKLNRLRRYFAKQHKTIIDLHFAIPRIMDKKRLDKMAQQQHSYSRQVTVLTWVMAVVTALALFANLIALVPAFAGRGSNRAMEKVSKQELLIVPRER